MREDLDYIKMLLEAFEAAPEPVVYVPQLKDAGLDFHDKKFAFHMGLLNDEGLVKRDDGKVGFGLTRGADGSLSWSIVPLRLTAAGHEFLEAIRTKDIWAKIKTEFAEGSFSTLVDISKQLLVAYAKRKLGLD
jgi:hypothetical protein